jgi:hypothetical protein
MRRKSSRFRAAWASSAQGNAPAPRTCAGMVYDSLRQRLLLFG